MERIGRYQITGELGRGAMGVVYRAQDPTIGRTVAIKTIRLGAFTNEKERAELRKRLFREAQSAGMLSHPGIVTIYDVIEEGDDAFIFMEFVNGPTLESLLEEEHPPTKELLLDLLGQVASALDYAHQRGIIHRDIKPANLMIHDGRIAKVTDFGVARIQSQSVTTAGGIMGTPNYMSPEQIRGAAVDGKADQFSLAVIVYELLTGEKPFAAETMATLLFKIVKEEPVAPQRLNPTLGPEIEAVLKRAMEKDPADRFPNCCAFISALEKAFSFLPDWCTMLPGASQQLPTMAAKEPAPAAVPAKPAVVMQHTVFQHFDPIPVPVPAAPPAAAPPIVPAASAATIVFPLPEAIPNPAAAVFEPEPEPEGMSTLMKGLLALTVLLLAIIGFYLFKPYLASNQPDVAAKKQSTDTNAGMPVIDPTKPSAMPAGVPATQPKPVPTPVQNVEKPDAPDEQPEAAPSKPSRTPEDEVLDLSSIPSGADITFDDDASKTCKTPCRFKLSPGKHKFIARLAGYHPYFETFQAPGQSELVASLEQITGRLYITTEPRDAVITVNGQPRAEHTPASFPLPVGTYTLTLSKDGYQPQTEKLTVRDGALGTLQVTLPRAQ